jgi:hypothetical protein
MNISFKYIHYPIDQQYTRLGQETGLTAVPSSASTASMLQKKNSTANILAPTYFLHTLMMCHMLSVLYVDEGGLHWAPERERCDESIAYFRTPLC